MSITKTVLFWLVLCICAEFLHSARSGGGYRGGGGVGYRRTSSRPRTTARPRTTQYYSSRGTTGAPYRQSTTPYSRTTARYPTAGSPHGTTPSWNLPARPGSKGYQGPEKVVYVNKYNYHYPGYYSVPVQQQSFPGYYHTPPYQYSSHDTGSTALGFFLGYGLGRLTTPTYSHYSFYDGYRPRYDHYEVHHYYHNKDAIPQNQQIQANTIVGCVGDSTSVCPANTTSLCTSNGALMCVVSATSTVPCTENRQVNCITSSISCVNNTAPECKNTNTTTISIPCVSTAKINGDIEVVNNTIVTNSTKTSNGTTNMTETTTISSASSSDATVTTTVSNPTTSASTSARKKREVPKDFCVTVVALPAEKKVTEGEKVYETAKDLVTKFIENAWGL